jgi:hypothetical protein
MKIARHLQYLFRETLLGQTKVAITAAIQNLLYSLGLSTGDNAYRPIKRKDLVSAAWQKWTDVMCTKIMTNVYNILPCVQYLI